jgi:hypothetical protein
MIGLGAARWAKSLQRDRQTYRGYFNFGTLQRQAEGRGEGTEPLEAEALAVEGVFREREEVKPPAPDIGKLTERVYQLLRREIRLEHERKGGDQS